MKAGLQVADTTGWTFSSTNADVLQVDASTGECTAQGAGTAELIATKDEQTLRKFVTVIDCTITGKTVLFATKDTDNPIVTSKEVYVVGALSGAGSIEIGDTTTLSLDMPEGLSLSSDALVWGSNNENVATVSAGVVTGKRAGTASIWVAPKEAVTVDAHGRTRVEGESYQSVNIMVKDSITSAQVAISGLGSQTYTGGAIQPAPVITYGNDTLWQGMDYELSYSNNIRVGLATIVITGKGCFAGSSRKVTFNIVPAKISDVEVTSIAKQAYTGKLVEPKPKLTYCGRALVLDTDYTLAYKNNKKAGTATIVIAGKGCFVGTKNVKFKIVAPTIAYRTYVQGYGWRSWAKNGKTSGTTGKARRAEAIKIKVTKLPATGGVKYRAFVQGMGWQAWKANGATTGLANKGKRLEALQIKLTGKLAKLYNVRYRVYRQKAGWTKWAKNGKTAGSATKGRRIEAIQIKIVPKS